MQFFSTHGSVESVLANLNQLFSTRYLHIYDFKIRPITYDERTLNLSATLIYDPGATRYQAKFFYGSVEETTTKFKNFLNSNPNIVFFEQFPFVFHKKALFLFIAVIYT